ncbi:MAG: SDR family oxidoreductase [Acidimicrobiales bacterium]|nr:SDR family oxidoreductase [Acidimicrobiales bacterium]
MLERSDFTGSTVLVTGAARNIGRAIALGFAAAGLDVAVHARTSIDEAEAVAAKARARGVRSLVVTGDLGDAEQCEAIVSRTVEELGPVDYLISNAARRRFQAFLDISPADWDAAISANLSSLFYLSRLVLPGMAARRFGRIVALGGPDGYMGWHHRAHNVTAKAGLTGLVKAISFEFGYSGVTANVLVPGGVDTVRNPEDYPPDMADQEGVPQGRPLRTIPRQGTVEELADACLFLASDRASYVTGQSFHVDGGLVMR